MKTIEKTLEQYPSLPFKLIKNTDTSYKTVVYHYLSVETDLDKTSVDISMVYENCDTKEEMDVLAKKIENDFGNITKVVEIEN